MTRSTTVTVPRGRTQAGPAGSFSDHRPAVRALLYSSVLTGGLLLVNGAGVTSAYATACGTAANFANSTQCIGGNDAAGLNYVADNPLYVSGDFTLLLDTHTVTGAAGENGITFSGVTAGDDGTIIVRNTSTVASGTGANGISSTAANAGTTTLISIETGSTVTGANNGIVATATGGGPIVINTQAGTTVTGNAGHGISGTGSGAGIVTINARGAATGTGVSNDGIHAQTVNGAASATTGAGAINGADNGIQASASGTGTASVTTGTGAVTGGVGSGILALGDSVTVDTHGNVASSNLNGIFAQADNGTASVTTAVGTTVTGGGGSFGIFATATGATGDAVVNAGSTVTGGGIGIRANSVNGTANVTTGAAAVTGNAGAGISAAGNSVIVAAGGNVTGTGGTGINAVADSGAVSVTTAAGTTVSGTAGDGITADATGGATVTANSAVTGAGAGNDGIEADGGTGGVDVTTFAGAITGDEDGIDVNAVTGTVKATTGAGDVTGKGGAGITANVATGTVTIVTGAGKVTGNSGEGIQANAATGTVNVTTAAGAISGSVDGIDANVATGDVKVITGAGQVTGNSGIGIDANAATGTVTVTTGTAAAVGFTGTGIDATASGAVKVEANGGATGTGGSGINARSFSGGNVEVKTAGGAAGAQVRGSGLAGSDGITAGATGAGTIMITNGAIALGTDAGIDATSAGGTIQIINNFSILNASGNDADLAIRTSGGNTTISNTAQATISGRVETGVGIDTLNNGNFWFTEGTSDFGGGNDTVNNNFSIVAGNNLGVADTTSFVNLENLNNNHTLILSEQVAGDGSNISDTLSTSGNYAGGIGSGLAVDAFLGGPGSLSDRLIIGGNTSGVTSIVVNDTNAGPGGFDPNGILVVDANAAGTADATNFVLDGGPIDKGFFVYDLLFDDANNDYLLVGLPDREVFETLAVVASAQEIFRETANAWSTRQENLRDLLAASHTVTAVADPPVEGSTAPMSSLWVSALGSWSDRDDDASFSLLNANLDFDMSYSQDIYGVVGGADFRTEVGTESSLLFGALAGYVDSKLDYDDSDTSIDTSGATIGAYAAFLSNGFFATILVKADLLDMDYSAAGDSDNADVTSYGARGDFGFRFGDAGLFVEPMVSVDAISTDIDEFSVGGADIDAGTNESFRAGAGLRAGFGDETFRASATARIWDVFSTDNEVEILAGVPLGISDDDLEGVYGDVSGQVDVSLSSSTTLYLKGGVLFSDDVTKPNASGGLAFYW